MRAGFKAVLEATGNTEVVAEAATGQEAVQAATEHILDALRAGASGFLLKDAPTQEVIAAVRAVAAGDAVLSAGVTRQLLDQVARRLPAPITREPDAAEA